MSSKHKQLLWLAFFSIAMGFLEAAVVVYLRYLYYPDGFRFPLTLMAESVVITELLREVATLIMLAGVAVLAGRTARQRFAFFLIAFGVWDIFYYVFLKLLLGWPESLLTWDILFLLPVPWVGPVLTPCLVSLTMILLAGFVYYRDLQNPADGINFFEWLLLISGSFVILLSWTWDYFIHYQGRNLISTEKSISFFSTYTPQTYNWWIFGLGELLLLSSTFIFFIRTRGR